MIFLGQVAYDDPKCALLRIVSIAAHGVAAVGLVVLLGASDLWPQRTIRKDQVKNVFYRCLVWHSQSSSFTPRGSHTGLIGRSLIELCASAKGKIDGAKSAAQSQVRE